MSRNAYRIKRIVTAKYPSFNLSHDGELVNFLEECTEFYENLNSYGNGIIEITEREFRKVKEKLEEVIDGLKSTRTNQPENREKAKCYIKVLAEMKKAIKKEGYISYEIY